MEENKNKLTKWWQWVLVYPTLILGLIGSVPTILQLYQSWKLDISREDVPLANVQHKLWERNADCNLSPSDWDTTILSINVDAKVCPSGDILISTKSFEKQKYMWISIEDIVNNNISDSSFSLINSALASPIAFQSDDQGYSALLCKRWIDKGQLLRRISNPENGCYDEVINTYTGEVISKTAVSCEATC